MKTRFFFVTLCFGLFLCTGPTLEAAPKAIGDVGTIDLATILVLHPEMRFFNPFNKAFDKDPRKLAASHLKKLEATQKTKVAALEKKKEDLEKNKDEARIKYNNEIQELEKDHFAKIEKLATGPAAVESHMFSTRRHRLERSFFATYLALESQQGQYQDQISQVLNNTGPFFTSIEETKSKFFSIIKEVRDVTKSVAAKQGINVVFDSGSYGAKTIPGYNISEKISSDANYGLVFSEEPPSEAPTDRAIIQGFNQIQATRVNEWLKFRHQILLPFQADFSNAFVVTGGIDLTKEVLICILDKHKVKNSIRKTILEALP